MYISIINLKDKIGEKKMKAKIIINKKEYEVEVTEEQLKEIEKKSKKRWRAYNGEYYFYIDVGGYIGHETEMYYESDDFKYSIGNYFKTKKEAEEYRNKLIYKQQYRDYVNEHNEFEIDWKDQEQRKYNAAYDLMDDLFCIDSSIVSYSEGVVYATSKQIIKDFIEEIGEDNFKKYILEIEG